MNSVSVITVNFNQHAVTEALLDSIFKTNTYAPLDIIVIDNGSTVNPVAIELRLRTVFCIYH